MDKMACPKTLKYLVIEKIISAHKCLNKIDNKQLCLPKTLFKELVQVGPSTIEMPKYSLFNDDNFCFEDTDEFHKSVVYDRTYSKYFVIWMQSLHVDKLSRYLPIIVHFLEIHFVIEFDNVQNTFFLCSKCLKLYLTVHYIDMNVTQFKIKRHYRHQTYLSLVRLSEILDRIKSKNNWCVSCRQVPLFQVANHNLCENIVGLTPHICVEHFPYDENNDEFIYCTNCYGTGTMTKFSFSREIDIETFFKN